MNKELLMNVDIPKVSVVMPVYKGDKYLSEAVDSILNQTFSDFEFIIICDDPTDETRYILDKYRQNDSRIQLYYQKRQGLVSSRNKGISLSKGEYVVKMDADDISLPDRLKEQVEFMDNHPDIGISGTWIKVFGDVPQYVLKLPCDHESIKSSLLFFCSIAQPSIIIRRDAFLKSGLCYDKDESHAEDYGLWVRAADVLKLANIPQAHVYYRMHTSTTNSKVQKEVSGKIRLSQIRKLGIVPTKVEFETHEALSYHSFEADKDFMLRAKLWLEKLQDANSRMNIYSETSFLNVLANYWYDVFCNSTNLGLDPWRQFNYSELSKFADLTCRKKLRLLCKPSIRYLINRISK